MSKHDKRDELTICDALKHANCLCRSALAIAKRGGEKTNWKAFASKLEGSLAIQHKVMLENDLIDGRTPLPKELPEVDQLRLALKQAEARIEELEQELMEANADLH